MRLSNRQSMKGYQALRDVITANQSVWLWARLCSLFLLPHLDLSERPCFCLTDSQPHLVTYSCCQHSFPEKLSCQTTLPWSKARVRVHGGGRRHSLSGANSSGDQWKADQSGVGSHVCWRVCDERKKPSKSPEWGGMEKQWTCFLW